VIRYGYTKRYIKNFEGKLTTMKKLFALILAVALCFTIVACGGDDNDTPTVTTGGNTNPTAPTSPTEGPTTPTVPTAPTAGTCDCECDEECPTDCEDCVCDCEEEPTGATEPTEPTEPTGATEPTEPTEA
jgi:hypothetical protein